MKHFLLLILLALLLVNCKEEKPKKQIKILPNIAYGADLNKYDVYYDTIEPNWTLSHLFLRYNISQGLINEAYNLAKDSANLNYITKGKIAIMLCSKGNDTIKKLEKAIYVKNLVDYYVFEFTDSTVSVKEKHKKVDTTVKEIAAKVKSGGNLSFALDRQIQNKNISYPLVDKIAGIYQWSIDFFHILPNDKLKIIYEELSVEGTPIGIGNVKAILFNHKKRDFYAFPFKTSNYSGFYTEKGEAMKSMFLSAPLKFSRISSSFTMRRFHPVQKRWKSHLGTDYAAPHGTPIWTTADGVIVKRGRTAGNGNYVKVKHNSTYATQYLHMSSFAKGQKVGDYVKQGEVIGYVGSTGLATGPHVCYRFWKNNKQVNPKEQAIQPVKGLEEKDLPAYLQSIELVKQQLDNIKYPTFINNVKAKIKKNIL